MRNKYLLMLIIVGLVLCAKEPPDDEEVERIFTKYEQQFIDAEQLCHIRSDIRSIKADGDRYQVTTELYDQEKKYLAKNEEEKIRILFKDAKIKQMNCLWLYSKGEGNLWGVSFTIYAIGLSVSGRFKSINHVLNPTTEWKEDREKRGELRKLPRENWFIYKSN